MLDTLSEQFGEKWCKIFVLMGVDFSDVEAELTHSTNIQLVKRRVSLT